MVNPKVSVIVPNYNHARFLRQRLESIYAQTYRDFELIILDDKSTDDSVDEIQAIIDERKDSGISVRLIVNTENTGSPFRQWRKGLLESHGEYVWIAESDDYADPGFLKRLVDLSEANGLTMCYSHSMTVDADGRTLGLYFDECKFYDEDKLFYKVDIEPYITRYNIIPNASAVLFRREISLMLIDKVQQLRWAGDWLFWGLILTNGERFGFVAQPLNFFRQHSSSVTAINNKKLAKYMVEQIKIVAAMHKAGLKCDADYWIERWLDVNNYHLREMSANGLTQYVQQLTRIDKWAAPKLMHRYMRLRVGNLLIKMGLSRPSDK